MVAYLEEKKNTSLLVQKKNHLKVAIFKIDKKMTFSNDKKITANCYLHLLFLKSKGELATSC